MLCIVSVLGLRAQTDVTSTYITNPSFEVDGAKTASNGALTITGWTQSDPGNQYNNTGTYNSTGNPPTQGTVTVTPSDGDYYLYFRKGWTQNATYTFTTSEAKNLPAGLYSLSVNYKMVEGYDDTQNNKTTITISAKNGETTLSTATGSTKTNVSKEGDYTYLNTAEWSTVTAIFNLDEAKDVNFVISLNVGGQRRSDFVVDNVRLKYWPIPSSPWTTGIFYLKNVAEEKYLSAGHDYGTRSDLNSVPMPIIIGKESSGYTFETRVSNGGAKYYLGSNLYCDSDKAFWIVKDNSDGTYSLSFDGIQYLASNGANNVLQTLTSITDAAKWQLVSQDDYISSISTATKASPVEATALIKDQNFGRNNRDFSSWTVTSGGGDAKKAGDNANMNWQQWNSTFDINQTVESLPAGLYSMKVQGFYRPGANNTTSTAQNSYIYAGEETPVAIQLVASEGAAEANAANGLTTANTNTGATLYVPNSQGDASKAFSAGLYDDNEITNILVSDGNLKIGAKCETNVANSWTVIDNFRLYYYGPTISTTAIKLPAGGAMDAGTWYYFDIASNATYDLSLTTLGDIVYTQDKKVLVEDGATVTTNFAKTDELELTAGRYYVKSSSSQSLVITAHVKVYEVGVATVSVTDGQYMQNVETVTFTYASANTNDGDASLAIVDGEAVATITDNATSDVFNGALSASGNVLTATFNQALTLGHTYTLALPANVFGYAGQSLNAAINQTINTPAIADGIYFLRTDDGKYASRGGSYNTRAMVDEFGLPMHLRTNADGTSEFIMVDSYFHLFDAGNGDVYTDNNSNPYWKIQATTGGYTITNANDNGSKDKFLGIQGDHLQSVDESYVWTIEPASDHTANVAPLKDAQAATAATAAGITASTKSELAAILDANYNAEAVSITGADGIREEYQVGAGSEFAGNGHIVFTETVEGLTPGLYKLTVKGFHRMTWYGDVDAASGVASNVYVFAGDAKTQICSPFDASSATARVVGNDYESNGKFYPNGQTAAGQAFDDGQYLNEVYVFVSGTSLTFGIFNPNRLGNDGSRGSWLSYRDFTLTRYSQTEANMTIEAGKYGTFVAPFDVTIPSGVTAQKVTGVTGSRLDFEGVETTIPANTPVVVFNETETAVNETFYGKGDAVGTVKPDGQLLTGVYEAVKITAGNYVLQTQEGVQAFYKLEDDATANTANRAYLTIPSSPVKAFFFNDEDADGINAVEATAEDGRAIYNLAGQRVKKAQKGLYIIGGKTVLVK